MGGWGGAEMEPLIVSPSLQLGIDNAHNDLKWINRPNMARSFPFNYEVNRFMKQSPSVDSRERETPSPGICVCVYMCVCVCLRECVCV